MIPSRKLRIKLFGNHTTHELLYHVAKRVNVCNLLPNKNIVLYLVYSVSVNCIQSRGFKLYARVARDTTHNGAIVCMS